jgi:hypothetical protein
MANNLPDGFVLDSNSKLPDGFQLDAPPRKQSSPKYRITHPDGRVYEVDAPNEFEALKVIGNLAGAPDQRGAQQKGRTSPKPWSAVAASPEYQSLSSSDQQAAKDQYFQSVVAPQVQPEDMDAARKQFITATSGPASSGVWDAIKGQAGTASQAGGDIVRLMGSGASMGAVASPQDANDRSGAMLDLGSRLSGGRMKPAPSMSPDDYSKLYAGEQQELQDAEQRAGLAGTVAKGIGMLGPFGAASKTMGAVGEAAGSVPLIGRMLSNPWTQAAAGGSAVGAVDATNNNGSAVTGALLGAGAGLGGKALGSVLASGVGKVAGAFNSRPVIPTADEVRQAAQSAYKAADDAGVIINPSASSRLADALKGDMADFGYSPHMQPMGRGVLDELGNIEGQNVTMKGLETFRKVAGRLRESQNPSEQTLGNRIVGGVDNFASGLGPNDVISGNPQAAVGALQDARSLWMRSAKASDLQDALEAAQNRAASSGTGGNIDNATRQNMRRLLESRDNWTPDETAALKTVVGGTPAQNALRLLGKASPEGNGLSMMLHLGAVLPSGGMSLPVAAAGAAAKYTADKMTRANVQRLTDAILAGGDVSALRGPPNAVQRFAASNREALVRALSGVGLSTSPELRQTAYQR